MDDKKSSNVALIVVAVVLGAGLQVLSQTLLRNEELWAAELSNSTAERARPKGLDVEAVMVPGDHFTSVPEAIRRSIKFFASH